MASGSSRDPLIHSMLVGDSSDFRPSCDSLPKTLRAFEGSFRRLPELIESDESSSCQAAGSVAAPLLALSAACWECSEASSQSRLCERAAGASHAAVGQSRSPV